MFTKTITLALTVSCLALPLLQAGDETTEAAIQPVANSEPAWPLDEEWQGLLGAWQLMMVDHVSELVPAESVRGFVTFQPGFMTMIIHTRTSDVDPQSLGQAGLYRWQMADGSILQTATMMGHSNLGEEFEWEPANIPREFRVELAANDLVLTRPDLSRLIFRRVRPGDYPESALERMRALKAGFDE